MCQNRNFAGLAPIFSRLVPALKDMSDMAVAAIIVLAVPGKHAMHDPSDGFRLPFDEQVKVIRHQTICVEEEV